MARRKVRVPARYKHGGKYRGKTISANEFDRRLQQSFISCGVHTHTVVEPEKKGIAQHPETGETILIA